MNLLDDPWIPVRSNSGAGAFQLLTYRALLCEPGQNWQISLPRDDLELACLQLLVCLTQVLFLPEDDGSLRARIEQPLDDDAYSTGVAPCLDWFDLDHPTQPFMQTRGVQASEATPIQKLLIGLPEGNNHAFFNEVGEVRQVSGPLAAIALFNQASNCPSFGGGFKGSLRGGAPITTLVFDTDLRRMVWRNVLTRQRLAERQIDAPGPTIDKPTWIEPIAQKSTIHWSQIGLMRGLFWQPAHVELIKADLERPCDVLGGASATGYSAFRKEKFNFTVQGVWPHPHGALQLTMKKGENESEKKFASFTTTAPAWTQLSEFVLPRSIHDADAKEGSTPAGPVTQAQQLTLEGKLVLLIGGYRTKKASVLERRHESIGLAAGWERYGRIRELVGIGKDAQKALRDRLSFAAQGRNDKGLKGIGVAIHEVGEKLFYGRTESLIHSTLSSPATFGEWGDRRRAFVEEIAKECRNIFEELTNPYATKPELIPVIAWSRRTLDRDLKKLQEDKA